jgi:hypothetical protein
MTSDFQWDLDKPLKELAREYEILVHNPDLMQINFKCRGIWLPMDKTLRELELDPTRDTIQIVSMFLPPLFDNDLHET